MNREKLKMTSDHFSTSSRVEGRTRQASSVSLTIIIKHGGRLLDEPGAQKAIHITVRFPVRG